MRRKNEESAEDRMIARYFRPIATGAGAFALTDDAAIIKPPPGRDLVLKVDAIVGGVHFLEDDPPGAAARKALRVNLSDLAAKGAKPAGFLLSLALPKRTSETWLKEFAAGLRQDARRYACPLLGGDSVRTPGPVTISVTAFGLVPAGKMVRRAGARPGDVVFVSGTIGDAALGLRLRQAPRLAKTWKLTEPERRHLLSRYLAPRPRTALAEALRRHASAAMDVSDGLAGDFAKLCRVSGVTAEIETGHVPLSPATRRALEADRTLITPILTGGDDYEILGTVPARRWAGFQRSAKAVRVRVTEIGRIREGRDAPAFLEHGRERHFKRPSFSHF
jgi:thiamine-monophosphate kinase